MKEILILGAGKSSADLVKYLLGKSESEDLSIVVADISMEAAHEKIQGHPGGRAVELDQDAGSRESLIKNADLVVSMLPARFHPEIAEICLKHNKNLITPSYVSDEMLSMEEQVKSKGLLFLNEMGLDPGLDHMSAMKIIDEIKETGADFLGFETFTGGLIAPESCKDNPWKYKFTWNPRNVVLAGQGIVKFIQESKYKYIPYHRLFRRTEILKVPGYGLFEGYANRDSLKYRKQYGLDSVKTIYRGTLRRPGFSRSWHTFVQLGATDDTYIMEGSSDMTHREFINSFLYYNPNDSVELKLAHYLRLEMDSEEMFKLKWLGIFDDQKVGLKKDSTPAQILQQILIKKWTLEPKDIDMIVMIHKFDYILDGVKKVLQSNLVVKGNDHIYTAMSKTVGLPIGIAAIEILNKRMNATGVHIPTIKEIYAPVLKGLEKEGIRFKDELSIVD